MITEDVTLEMLKDAQRASLEATRTYIEVRDHFVAQQRSLQDELNTVTTHATAEKEKLQRDYKTAVRDFNRLIYQAGDIRLHPSHLYAKGTQIRFEQPVSMHLYINGVSYDPPAETSRSKGFAGTKKLKEQDLFEIEIMYGTNVLSFRAPSTSVQDYVVLQRKLIEALEAYPHEVKRVAPALQDLDKRLAEVDERLYAKKESLQERINALAAEEARVEMLYQAMQAAHAEEVRIANQLPEAYTKATGTYRQEMLNIVARYNDMEEALRSAESRLAQAKADAQQTEVELQEKMATLTREHTELVRECGALELRKNALIVQGERIDFDEKPCILLDTSGDVYVTSNVHGGEYTIGRTLLGQALGGDLGAAIIGRSPIKTETQVHDDRQVHVTVQYTSGELVIDLPPESYTDMAHMQSELKLLVQSYPARNREFKAHMEALRNEFARKKATAWELVAEAEHAVKMAQQDLELTMQALVKLGSKDKDAFERERRKKAAAERRHIRSKLSSHEQTLYTARLVVSGIFLFIGLCILAFGLFGTWRFNRIHHLQYMQVGIGISIFGAVLVLLSLWGFWIAKHKALKSLEMDQNK